MKRLFRKGNPVGRLIALWIAFIMVAIPLFENAGPLKSVKAATYTYQHDVTVSLGTDRALVEDASSKLYVEGKAVTAPYPEIHYYNFGQTINIGLNPTVSGSLKYDDGITEYDVTGDYSLTAVTLASEPTVNVTTTEPQNEALGTLQTEYYLAVYIKMNDTITLDGSTTASGSATYTLLAVYKVIKHTDFGVDGYWVDSNGTVLKNNAVSNSGSFTIVNPETVALAGAPEGSVYLGEFKRYYANASATGNTGKDERQDYNGTGIIEFTDGSTVSIGNGKVYYAWIDYELQASEGTYSTYSQSAVGNKITADTKAPTFKWGVFQANGSNMTAGANNTYRVGVDRFSNETFRYWLMIEDENHADSIIFYFEDEEGNITEIESNEHSQNSFYLNDVEQFVGDGKQLAVGKTYKVYVKPVDKPGNESSQTSSLGNIKFIDTSLKVTNLDGSAIASLGTDPTNQTKTFNLKISSGYQLTSIEIKAGDTPLDYKDLSGVQAADEIYQTTYTYELPADATQDVKYEDIKIVVTDTRPAGSDQNNPANKKTITLGDFDYDITPPEIQSCMIGTWDGQGNVTNNIYGSALYLDANQSIPFIDATIYLKETHYKDKLSVMIKGSDNSTEEFTFDLDNTDGTDKYTEAITSAVQKVNVKYTIYAKLEDSVGNKANNGNWCELGSVMIIDKDLHVVSATMTDNTETWDVYDTSTKTSVNGFKNSPTNAQNELKLTIESGYSIEDVVIKDKNGTIDNGYFDLRQVQSVNGIYGAEITYKFPSQTTQDRAFEDLQVVITDTNSDATKKTITIDLGDFTYDKTAPVLEDLGIYKKTGTDTYVKITENDLFDKANKEYVIDTTKTGTEAETFVIVYGAYDAGGAPTGLDDTTAKLYLDSNGNNYVGDLTKAAAGSALEDLSGNTVYYVEFTTDELLANFSDKVTFYANVEDMVGNSPELEAATYTLVLPNNALVLTGNLKDQYGNLIDVKNLKETDSYITNKQFVLTLTATSGYEIESMKLMVGGIELEDIALNPNEKDEGAKKFSVTQTITLPEGTNPNTIMNGIQVVVTDKGGQDKTVSLGDLLFDMTNPTVKKKDGTALGEDTTWYQSYTLEASITAGVQSTESDIADVKYSIDNSMANATDKTDGVNKSGKTATVKINVPESANSKGTKVVINATDMANNSIKEKNVATIRVDATNPKVDALSVSDSTTDGVVLAGDITIKTTARDNLSLSKIDVVVESVDGTKKYPKDVTFESLQALSDDGSDVVRDEEFAFADLADGSYKVTVTAYDKSGRASTPDTMNFVIDNTKPVVTAKIADGIKGGKKPGTNFDGTSCDQFYRSDVTVEFTKSDVNLESVTVTDNNKTIYPDWTYDSAQGKYVASYKVTSDGLHTIIISGKDKAGNEAVPKTIYFTKDTKVPVISAMINGAITYNEADGVRVFTADTTLSFSESDDNKDLDAFYYQLTKKVPDEDAVVGKSEPTAYRSFTYTEEAEYTVKVYSTDMASNVSATRTVQFRIDKTAPNISIGGIGDGGTSSNPVTVSLNMQELYWRDATGTVQIYMKQGEGFGEELVEEITYTPTGRNSVITRSFAESGIYRIEFNAQDSAGHTATTSSAFTIDTEVPVVTLEGVSNFDVTDQDVTITSTITDKFYASKQVTISGTVTDETGKVTPLAIDDYSETANPTVINKTFSADGIYDLTISCVDVAGNTDSQSVHFIIDKSDPVIGDLSDIDGKILTSFNWDKDLDELVSDLTVCDVHMYLNGQEYNGEDAVEDGSYILLITAEDELGHKVEKSVEFVLDTKAPVFIVTGVEDKDSKIEPYSITVSLQLEEDTLTSVTLNGQVVTINNNQATINVTEIGEYKLYMEAVDEAGNVSSAEYEFELESEKEFNFWIIIAIAAVFVIAIIIILLKKKKADK